MNPSRTGVPAQDIAPSVVVVTAPWCPECRRMQPIIDSARARHPGVEVEPLNIDTDPEQARALRIMGTPTVIARRGGNEVARLSGRRSQEEVDRLFAALSGGGPVSHRTPGSDLALRFGAAVVLGVAGLLTGPSWPLLAIGSGVGVYGLAGLQRRTAR